MGKLQTAFAQLNQAQRQAVDTIEGPLLVIAGPGTGKTQLLSLRVANILQQTDASPANILCLTFTEAAARNMRERLGKLIGEAAYHVGIFTFHSFGSDIIQRYPEYFLDQPLLKPVDELGAYELLRNLFAKMSHSNPLYTVLGDDFLHLHSAQAAIGWLKQAGILPAELRQIAQANHSFIAHAEPLIEPVFKTTPSPKLLPEYKQLLHSLRDFSAPLADTTLADLLTTELADAIAATNPTGRYAQPITQWRNKWLVQNHFRVWVLADRRRNKFLQALAGLYEDYQAALAKRGWYTFDDMILRTSGALEQQEELRLTLQEQYHYILVDEYQDTNGAQNRLLELLADNPVAEGRPNLMVVGDDDQAIYRFQGAHMSVMLDFVQRWRHVEQVVLTENYRSGQPLLQLSRHIIKQGQDRLETRVPNLSKVLRSSRTTPATTVIERPQTVSELDQYQYVAKLIRQLVDQGTDPSQIAVLAPKHSFLQNLVPYLLDQRLPINYERREHILDQPQIVELLELAQLVQAAAEGQWSHVDALLPKVLAAAYWELSPLDLWQLSLQAYQQRQTWPQAMLDRPAPLPQFAQALLSLAQAAHHQPLDAILDQLIGNQPVQLADGTTWHVPYRNFYFSAERLDQAAQDYFRLLGQLTSLRDRVRQYRPDQPLNLQNFLEFVDLYRQSNLTLLDTNPHSLSSSAVNLLTAYKAKGLEWDTVFVLGCHNDIWGTKARASNYSFGLPSNLAWIKPARDSHDDRLRLFYVALTRAKNRLYLTCFQKTTTGKTTETLGWLTNPHPNLPEPADVPPLELPELIRSQEIHWGMTHAEQTSLRDNLQPYLDKYQLSATHLASFLDLSKGGPKHFFFSHILHFPESLQPSAVFGSAIHQALHFMHSQFSRQGQLPLLPDVQALFQNKLSASALTPADLDRLQARGQLALAHFYQHCGSQLEPTDKSEYNFANEGVVVGPARLTGQADVLRSLADGSLCIIDYKTGAAMPSWQAKPGYGQIRAHLYKQQLAFYHLLVQGAAHFQGRSIHCGKIQFVEPDEDGNLPELEFMPNQTELDRLQKLITVIWQHVMELNFPDTSSYSLDLKGIKQFEEDLLAGKL